MIVYHSTTEAMAKEIIQNGFRDSKATYGTDLEWIGVFVCDKPLDVNEGAKGSTVLRITLPVTEDELAPYEWAEEGKPFREWCVPASLLNRGTVQLDEQPQ
jgi:hypothetical protein